MTTRTQTLSPRLERKRAAEIAAEAGFPYEYESAAALASAIATTRDPHRCVVASVAVDGDILTFVGFHGIDMASEVAASMRRKRAIRVTGVVVAGPAESVH